MGRTFLFGWHGAFVLWKRTLLTRGSFFDCFLTARSWFRLSNVKIVQCYALMEISDVVEKDVFS